MTAMARQPILRRGMTLIELLVVVAIMMLLIITVAPNLATTAEARRGREATRMVSSFISKAQSRAIGRTDWSGFMLAATNTASFAAIDLFLADVPPVYRGDTVPALLTSNPVSVASAVATGNAGQLTLSGTAGVQTGDLIRFQGSGSLYEVSDVSPTNSPTSIQFRPRSGAGAGNANAIESAGFSAHNTPWPPSGVPLAFEVLRQPVPAGSPLTLGESRAVDLYWSGIGPPTLTVGATVFGAAAYRPFAITASGSFATAGASTAVMFDGTGRLRQAIVRSGATVRRIAITGPLYLLVGRADRAGQAFDPSPSDDSRGANWQYSDSFWIAIDPATGVVKTAESTFFGEDDNRNASLDPGEDRNGNNVLDIDVVASQRWIRESLLGSGR
jgi:prepilin-type N-terminal cleavage/methylation domain-containing protein